MLPPMDEYKYSSGYHTTGESCISEKLSPATTAN